MEAWRSSLRVAWPGPRGRGLVEGAGVEDGRSQAESALLLLLLLLCDVLGVGMSIAAEEDAVLFYCRRQREAGCMFSMEVGRMGGDAGYLVLLCYRVCESVLLVSVSECSMAAERESFE